MTANHLGRVLPLCLAFALVPALQPLHAEAFSESELKAAFVYKFAQFTTWPMNPPPKEIHFCVLGPDPFQGALQHFEGKALKDAVVKVKYVSSPEEAKSCQVVFLNPPGRSDLVRWTGVLQLLPVLTISDAPDSLQAKAIIALTVAPNRIVFSINAATARAAGLTLNAQLLKLAQEVR